MKASREDRPLPKDFFANFLAAVAALYPDARLNSDSVGALYELAADEWRAGRQLHVIVREVCSCDGRSVYPSAGAAEKIGRQRRLARAPQEAEDGAMFGLEELRDTRDLETLKARIARLETRIQKTQDGIPHLRTTYANLIGAGQKDRAQRLAATIASAEEGLEDMKATLAAALKQEEELLAGRPWSRLIPRPPAKARAPKAAKAKPPRARKAKEPRQATVAKKSKKKSPAKVLSAASTEPPAPIIAKRPAKPKQQKEVGQTQQAEMSQKVRRRKTPGNAKTTTDAATQNPSPEVATQLPDLVDDDLTAEFLNSVASRAK